MTKRVLVSLPHRDLIESISERNIVQIYGHVALIDAMSMDEVMGALDYEEVLDFIGIDKIKKYMDEPAQY